MTMILKHRIQLLIILRVFFQVVEVTRNQVGPMNWFAWLQVFVCIYPYHEPILPDAFPMPSSHHMLLGVNRSNQGIGKRPFPGPCTAFISGPGFRSVSQAPEQLVPDFFGTIPKKLIAGCFEGDPPDLWKSSSEVVWKSLSEFLSTNLIDTEHHQYFF